MCVLMVASLSMRDWINWLVLLVMVVKGLRVMMILGFSNWEIIGLTVFGAHNNIRIVQMCTLFLSFL